MPKKLIAYLFMMLIPACAVGPDFHKPDAPNVTGYTPTPLTKETASANVASGASQHFAENTDIPNQWWKVIYAVKWRLTSNARWI